MIKTETATNERKNAMKNEKATIRRLMQLDESACEILNEVNRKLEKLEKLNSDERLTGEICAYMDIQEFILFRLKSC